MDKWQCLQKELSGRVYLKGKKSAAQINWSDIFMVASFGASANPLICFFLFPQTARWSWGGGVVKRVFMSLSKMPSASVIQPYHKIVFQISYNWIQTVPSVSDWLYPP